MLNLGLFKLFVDAALVMSLVFLCFRFMRGGRSSSNQLQVDQLEKALRSLVSEAEEAGRSLDSQLQRRKGELEQALFDIDLAENRLKRAVSFAKESASEIITVDSSVVNESKKSSQTQPSRSQLVEPQRAVPSRAEPKKTASSIPTSRPAPSLRTEIIVDDEVSLEEEGNAEPISWGSTNIFGQPLGQGPEEGLIVDQLQATRESPVTRANLEEIHSGAEDALKIGRELQAAAVRQASPRQTIEVTREESIDSDTQVERLGVLAPIRRHTQVV